MFESPYKGCYTKEQRKLIKQAWRKEPTVDNVLRVIRTFRSEVSRQAATRYIRTHFLKRGISGRGVLPEKIKKLNKLPLLEYAKKHEAETKPVISDKEKEPTNYEIDRMRLAGSSTIAGEKKNLRQVVVDVQQFEKVWEKESEKVKESKDCHIIIKYKNGEAEFFVTTKTATLAASFIASH